jgi:hypothetical protein
MKRNPTCGGLGCMQCLQGRAGVCEYCIVAEDPLEQPTTQEPPPPPPPVRKEERGPPRTTEEPAESDERTPQPLAEQPTTTTTTTTPRPIREAACVRDCYEFASLFGARWTAATVKTDFKECAAFQNIDAIEQTPKPTPPPPLPEQETHNGVVVASGFIAAMLCAGAVLGAWQARRAARVASLYERRWKKWDFRGLGPLSAPMLKAMPPKNAFEAAFDAGNFAPKPRPALDLILRVLGASLAYVRLPSDWTKVKMRAEDYERLGKALRNGSARTGADEGVWRMPACPARFAKSPSFPAGLLANESVNAVRVDGTELQVARIRELLLAKDQPVPLGQRPDVWEGTLDLSASKLSEGGIALLGQLLAFDPGEPPAAKPAPPTMPQGGAVLPRLLLERTLAGGAPQFGRRFVRGVRLRNCALDVHTCRLLLAAKPGVQELWLSQNNVGDAAADCVTQCPRLTKLGLERGGVYDAHAARLAEQLLPVEGKDPPLVELRLGASPFGGNSVGIKGAEGLSQVLMKNRTLRVLRLDNNPLGDAGVRAIWTGLHQNAELKVLGLDNTEWTNKGAETAVRGLIAQDPSARRGPLLEELHCGGNELEESALVALMELLESTVPRIETISAWKCGKRHGLSKELLNRIHDFNGRVIL